TSAPFTPVRGTRTWIVWRRSAGRGNMSAPRRSGGGRLGGWPGSRPGRDSYGRSHGFAGTTGAGRVERASFQSAHRTASSTASSPTWISPSRAAPSGASSRCHSTRTPPSIRWVTNTTRDTRPSIRSRWSWSTASASRGAEGRAGRTAAIAGLLGIGGTGLLGGGGGPPSRGPWGLPVGAEGGVQPANLGPELVLGLAVHEGREVDEALEGEAGGGGEGPGCGC